MYFWVFDYQEGLSLYIVFGFMWYNEGYILNYYCDGQVVQFWGCVLFVNCCLVLLVGVGLYCYFDMVLVVEGCGYLNMYGWGVLMSVCVVYYMLYCWIVQFQVNCVQVFGGFDMMLVMFGVGYQFDVFDMLGLCDIVLLCMCKVMYNEVMVMFGEMILNSCLLLLMFGGSIEYWCGFMCLFDWIVMWMYEGVKQLVCCNGIVFELWFMCVFLNDKVMLLVGVGVYFIVNQCNCEGQLGLGDGWFFGIVLILVSYWIFDCWFMCVIWNCVVMCYDCDIDVIQVGVGYWFQFGVFIGLLFVLCVVVWIDLVDDMLQCVECVLFCVMFWIEIQ